MEIRRRHVWTIFALAVTFWAVAFLILTPSFSGEDVFFFRDAGWNLAASGRFETVVLKDLRPHFYAYYTPLVPLAFAAFCAIFGRNEYSGTLFNALLGFLTAGAVLGLIFRSVPKSSMRNATAIVIAAFPLVFVSYDRPETLGIALFALTLAAISSQSPNIVIVGFLVGITFLADPFAAILEGIVVTANNVAKGKSWKKPLLQSLETGGIAAALIAFVATLYYFKDRTSLIRFASNAFGRNTGLGVVHTSLANAHPGGKYLEALKHGISDGGIVATWYFALCVSIAIAMLVLSWANRADAHRRLLYLSAALMPILTLVLFPSESAYFSLAAVAAPLALLGLARSRPELAQIALGLILFICVSRTPPLALELLKQVESRSSYLAARGQPQEIAAQLDPTDVVAIRGNEYDLFKPRLPRLVNAKYNLSDFSSDLSAIKGIVNCYDSFEGPSTEIRPLPSGFDPSQFTKIDSAPVHVNITLFGRRLMRRQWGWGCDLYVRNHLLSEGLAR